jgi:hypothetical protein
VRKNCIGKITQVKKENEKIRVDFSRERLETWCKPTKEKLSALLRNKMEKADKLFKSLSVFTLLFGWFEVF